VDVVLAPEPDRETRRALELALARAAIDSDSGIYASRWRIAGLVDGVARRSDAESLDGFAYTPSPRSTRGAIRA
jgi:hypothetical protein